MGLFRPPIGSTSVGDASTLNGKTENQLSVGDSAKLGGVSAETYADGLIEFPDATLEKQLLYRNIKENKIVNNSFSSDLTGWTFDEFGELTESVEYRDVDNYHSSPSACYIAFDTTGLSGEMGVTMIQVVDLTGVESLEFYAKQISESTFYSDVNVSNFYVGETSVGINVTGKTGGESGFIDGEWRRCYSESIPSNMRVPNQTLTFYFTTQQAKNIELVVDDFLAYGTPSETVAWINDIDEYIDNEIDVHLDTPSSASTRKSLYRTTLVNGISSGDMERASPAPWYGPDFGETLSMDSSIYHSGSKSLKSTFDLGSGSSTYLMLDDIDLTDVDEITFWMYGGANCANGTVGPSLGEMPNAQSFATGSWTQITYTVPSGNKTTGQNLSLELTCDAGSDIVIYLDDVVALVAPSDIYGWGTSPIYHGSLSSAPASNVLEGDEYYNTGDSKFYKYNGSSWIALN